MKRNVLPNPPKKQQEPRPGGRARRGSRRGSRRAASPCLQSASRRGAAMKKDGAVFLRDKNDPSVIVFSEIKRCQLPHSTQFFKKQKTGTRWSPSARRYCGRTSPLCTGLRISTDPSTPTCQRTQQARRPRRNILLNIVVQLQRIFNDNLQNFRDLDERNA